MSYTKEKKERIINYILEKISLDESKFTGKVAKTFDTTDTTIRRYIAELLQKEIIIENAEKKCGYSLKVKKFDNIDALNAKIGDEIQIITNYGEFQYYIYDAQIVQETETYNRNTADADPGRAFGDLDHPPRQHHKRGTRTGCR